MKLTMVTVVMESGFQKLRCETMTTVSILASVVMPSVVNSSGVVSAGLAVVISELNNSPFSVVVSSV